jgi:hypothetical protein
MGSSKSYLSNMGFRVHVACPPHTCDLRNHFYVGVRMAALPAVDHRVMVSCHEPRLEGRQGCTHLQRCMALYNMPRNSWKCTRTRRSMGAVAYMMSRSSVLPVPAIQYRAAPAR